VFNRRAGLCLSVLAALVAAVTLVATFSGPKRAASGQSAPAEPKDKAAPVPPSQGKPSLPVNPAPERPEPVGKGADQAWKADPAATTVIDPQFALDLFRSLATREPAANLVISPLGVGTALAVLHAGAKERTAAELAAVLHLPATPAAGDRPASSNAKQQAPAPEAATKPATDRTPIASELLVATSLWTRKGEPLLATFRESVEALSHAHVEAVDFTVPESRKPIEAWFRKETGGLGSDILGPALSADRVSMLLLNVTRFKARWRTPFPTRATSPAPFQITPDRSVEVPMMCLKAGFAYNEDEAFQTLELPYDDAFYSMILLLPRKSAPLEDLEYALDAAGLRARLGRMKRSKVRVYLPRFAIDGSWSMRRDLARLNAASAFSDEADFSGIDGSHRLRLSSFVHGAFLRVDEVGTEAGSATVAALIEMGLERVPTFRADHPFLFLIRDNRSGSILFLGRVANPAPPPRP
jgi:serpin B